MMTDLFLAIAAPGPLEWLILAALLAVVVTVILLILIVIKLLRNTGEIAKNTRPPKS